MSVRRHLGFGSTPNFPNLYKEVQRNTDNSGRLAHANYDPSLGISPTDAQIELLQNYQCEMPLITFRGSEKLHGENMAVCYSQGEVWVQGRNQVRTILGDQNGMAAFVEKTKQQWVQLSLLLADKYNISLATHTIVIDCEWAGGNIQKGNAACSGTAKAAYIFDFCRIVNNDTDESQYKSTKGLTIPADTSIYLMSSFDSYSVLLDFNDPLACETALKALAESIEDDSSIAKHFDKPDNVGEGAYLWALHSGKVYRLKAKGEKHGGKPKEKKTSKKTLTDDEKEALETLADKLTPVWRITQAITETNSTERKHVGEVIKWVIADIAKEEAPALADANIELKQVNGFVASIVKDYFFDHIKGY